jgi:molybdate transport system ATP-binding protein
MSGLVVEAVDRPLGSGRLRVERLEVADGETLVLFGPNGAGKSSLLRIAAGLGGRRHHLAAAYLPQRAHAFRGAAARTLGLGLDDEAVERAERLAADLGVSAVLDRPARSLSGGERQRIALARVLARPDAVVLLDEPFAPLDARDRGRVASVVAGALYGRTAMVVTHDLETAVMLGDRMAVMVDGSVRQVGPVDEVVRLPLDESVSGVLGAGNVARGTVIEVDPPLAAVDLGDITAWGIGEAEVGDRAAAVFGAEAVTVFAGRKSGAGSARNTWPGRVEGIRPLGRLVEVVVDTGVPVVALLTPGSIEALQLRVGSPVTVAAKATAVRVVPR